MGTPQSSPDAAAAATPPPAEVVSSPPPLAQNSESHQPEVSPPDESAALGASSAAPDSLSWRQFSALLVLVALSGLIFTHLHFSFQRTIEMWRSAERGEAPEVTQAGRPQDNAVPGGSSDHPLAPPSGAPGTQARPPAVQVSPPPGGKAGPKQGSDTPTAGGAHLGNVSLGSVLAGIAALVREADATPAALTQKQAMEMLHVLALENGHDEERTVSVMVPSKVVLTLTAEQKAFIDSQGGRHEADEALLSYIEDRAGQKADGSTTAAGVPVQGDSRQNLHYVGGLIVLGQPGAPPLAREQAVELLPYVAAMVSMESRQRRVARELGDILTPAQAGFIAPYLDRPETVRIPDVVGLLRSKSEK